MAVTKITVSTAMRARDVSRPGTEHLAAAGRTEGATGQPEAPAAAPPPAQAAPAAPTAARQSGLAEPAQAPSRRRRRRGR